MAFDNWGNPVFQDFEQAIAAGWVGNPPNQPIAGRSTCYGAAATLNTTTNIFGTTYTQQATTGQRSVNSTSASDAAAGTGARTVTINYLDSNMVAHSETVTLNGLTAVNTVGTDIFFVESIVVVTCGSNLANVGVIQIFTTTAGGGSVFGSIAVGDNATFWGQHYVPAGVTCYVLKHTGCGTLSQGRTLMVRTGDPRSVLPIQQIGDIIIHLAGASEDHEYKVPLSVPGPDRIILRENPIVSTAGNLAYASFDYVQF